MSGREVPRQVPTDWLGREAVITRPHTTDALLRDTRRLEMAGGWPALQYDQTDLGGVYEVGVNALEPPVALRFAAQPDPGESLLDELSAEQKKMLSAVAHVGEWGPKFSWREQVERERRGSEFWLPLLLAALLVAVLEMALAQWFSRSR